jgi:hypothetical protein
MFQCKQYVLLIFVVESGSITPRPSTRCHNIALLLVTLRGFEDEQGGRSVWQYGERDT